MAQSDLDFTLDRGTGLPLGAQLAWRLRTVIASGELAEGERLPGVREMAERAGVNVNTVRSVYARLADEGAIVSEHGRGTFVASRAAAEAGLAKLAAAFGGGPAAGRPAAGRPAAGRPASGALPASGAPAASSAPFRGSDPIKSGGAEARRRASLRAEIALLERELAALDVPANGDPRPADDRAAAPTPQLLTADDLERVRDELIERLRPQRADRTTARHELEGERHERAQAELVRRPSGSGRGTKQRAIATSTPKFETGAGGWSLRWRG